MWMREMEGALSFLDQNKEWMFSGLGVVALTGIVSLFLRRRDPKQSVQQKQTGGHGSTNIQVGVNNSDGPGE
jgi:hypothetical protein